MNDTNNQGTSILLPSATVDFFLKDKETAEAARQLVDDWRYARVTVSVEEGDVETAIEAYKQANSPSLIIIESDTTDDILTERLEALSAHCNEGTNAIIIGPVNDVNLYRKLTSMGVSDYLVRPVPLETLSEVIAKTLIEQIGVDGSRLVAVVGSAGGVGTSSVTQAMALGLSEYLKQKTLVMDAAGGWSGLGVGLGYEPVGRTSDATRVAATNDFESMKRLLVDINERLSVIATGTDPMLESMVEGPEFETMIDMMMTSYPVVMVDLSGARPSLKKTVLAKAHDIVFVSTPTLSSLRAARTLMQEIKIEQGGALHGLELVINKQGTLPSSEVPSKDIKDVLGREPSVVLPYDPKIFLGAETEGKRINQVKGGDDIIRALKPVLQKIVKSPNAGGDENEQAEKGLLNSVLRKLKK